MDFEARAKRAADRGDSVHAVLLLAEGLERHPERSSALERLVELYLEQLESPGVESEVVEALASIPEGAQHLDRLLRELETAEQSERLRALRRAREESDRTSPPSTSNRSDTSETDRTTRSGGASPGVDTPPPASEDDETPVETSPGAMEAAVASESSSSENEDFAWSAALSRPALGGTMILLLAGAVWWIVGTHPGRERIDRHLRQLDTTRLERIESLFDDELPSTRPFRERRAFVRALTALERGEVYQLDASPTTSWGIAAAAMAALTRGDLERAVRAETKLRRMSDSRLLPCLWIEGRVAEYRGQFDVALDRYRRGLEAFPEFVPFQTGRIRLALRRLDRASLQSAIDDLEAVHASHPYVRLRRFPFPEMLRLDRNETSTPPDAFGLEDFRFGRVVRRYIESLRALRSGDPSRAREVSERVLDLDRHFAPALWVRATACASRFQLEPLDESLERLVDFGALSTAYRWRLRVLGPRLLRTSGHAARALRYVLPGLGAVSTVPDSRNREEDDTEPEETRIHPLGERPPSDGSDRVERLRHRARLERMRVLVSLGRLRRARLRFEQAPASPPLEFDYELLGAELDILSGRRPISTHALDAGRGDRAPRLAMAFYLGRYDQTVALARASLSERALHHPRVARYLALGYASRGRGRRAMQVLAELDPMPADVPLVRRLRTRIRARLAHATNRGSRETRTLPISEETTSTGYLLDAASTAIWQARLDRAERASRRALDRRPRDPQGHWFRGLVARLEGESQTADRHLRRSWRTDGTDRRLELELGHVHLALGHYDHARDLFFHAVLADRSSLEAIRGLGRACLGLGDDVGRWNFKQILESFQEGDVGDLYVAELLRWLAIFHGSREGRDEARTYLDRATEVAGRRALIVMETARWFEARDQLERASELYLDALETNSTLAEAHLGLARVAREQSKPGLARTHLKRYLALEPGSGPETRRARRDLERLEAETP